MTSDDKNNLTDVSSAEENGSEAVVGVFPSADAARAAVVELRNQNFEFAEIDRQLTGAADDARQAIRDLFYPDSSSRNVEPSNVAAGVAKGAAIGAASGLLFIAVPVINVVAPIGGMLGGALIGGMAGIDEANRHSRLPSITEYRNMISAGKGLVILHGDEQFRIRIGNELAAQNAEAVYQHPPVLHAFNPSKGEVTREDETSKSGESAEDRS